MSNGSHFLVLGGSAGVGLAYATLRAREGTELTIVARRVETLATASELLRHGGAKEVHTVPLDLANGDARRAFLRSIADGGPRFDGMFIGGPSPPSGRRETITPEMAAIGYEVALAYPLEAMDTARTALRQGGRLIILSSSASREPLAGHVFFLSAAYRRVLDMAVKEFESTLSVAGCRVAVWRPKVVLTELSMRFATQHGGATSEETAKSWLAQQFGVPEVPTALEFAETMERKLTE